MVDRPRTTVGVSLYPDHNRVIEEFRNSDPLAIEILEDIGKVHPGTLDHSVELAILAESVAKMLGFKTQFTDSLKKSAALHDTGKEPLVRRDPTLLDRSVLLPEERRAIGTHPWLGLYRLIGHSDPIVPVVAFGHHRAQANAYPNDALNFREPKGSLLLPTLEQVLSDSLWPEDPLKKEAQWKKLRSSLEDPRIVKEAYLAVQVVAAIDQAQATWVSPTPATREYLMERLAGEFGKPYLLITENEFRKAQDNLWGRVAGDYLGNPKIMKAAMSSVQKRYTTLFPFE